MGLLQKIKSIWQKLGLVQQVLLGAIVVTFVLAGAILVRWAGRPDMRMLYQDLGPEEASAITDKLTESGIAYELRSGGTAIYVPRKNVYQCRLDMAKDGLPSGGQGGYKIFDNEKIGISPFVQTINLKRALQEELAKSIQIIDGVAYAKVHIVNSEQTLFTEEAGKTTASVVIVLKPGYTLSNQSVASIRLLVSGGVEGLTLENVTVVDNQGNSFAGATDHSTASGTGTIQDSSEKAERHAKEKVEELLLSIVGPGRSKVTVNAVVDTNSVRTITEKYEPKGVATKEEITTGSETGAGATQTSSQPTLKKDETILTEYEVGKTVTEETILPGKIKSLSVAVVVDLSNPDPNAAGAGGQPAKIMDPNEVEELIIGALGLDLAGSDSVKVLDVPMAPVPQSVLAEEPSGGLDFVAIARQGSLGIMAICALLVLRMFRSAKKKTQTEAAGQLSAGENMGLLPGGTGQTGQLTLRKQVASALKQDPERVKQLFTSWIEERD